MKKSTSFYLKSILVAVIIIASSHIINAQTLFGTTSQGGDSSGGVVFSYDLLSHQYKVAQSLSYPAATSPYSDLMQASDGNLYGMTPSGGAFGNGAIFRIDLAGNYKILASFNYATGEQPKGRLTQAFDGNLYGTTSQGGQNSCGTLFKFNITNDSITPLVSFNYSTTGQYPGNLLAAKDSNLYGVTDQGGAFGSNGAFFKYSIKKDTIIALAGLNRAAYTLIQAYDGYIYGVENGDIFKATTSGVVNDIVSFSAAEGSPTGIIQATDSSFYGMTGTGGTHNQGIIFKFNQSTGITVLANFNDTNGSQANSTLIQGTDGFLYGMTPAGGKQGNIFKCSTSGVITNLVDFTGPNGDWPEGALIQASDGNLYGMTQAGGQGQGVLFRCSTSGTINTLVTFGASTFGSFPQAGVIQATDGNLYGTAIYGGAATGGAIYKMTLSDSISNVANLSTGNGTEPAGSLFQATDGNIYGAATSAGLRGSGTIFKYNPVTKVLDTAVSFNGTNGELPQTAPIQASDGNLYGTTYYGGAYNYGVLYEISKTGVYTVLASFGGADQANPAGNLVQASDGNLYGTTSGISGYHGTIFQYILSTHTLNNIYTFSGSDGTGPQGNFVLGFDGNLYGTTLNGGSGSYGTVFKCTTSGSLTTLVNFNGANGGTPHGIMQASDSNLYGVTGGISGAYGTIFKCTTSGAMTTLFNFNDTTGINPEMVALVEVRGVKVSVTSPGCTSQTITATPAWHGKSPYSYSWSTGATTSSLTGITTAGTYTVLVTDGNGISYSGSVYLPAYVPLAKAMSNTNVPCYGDNTGSASITVTGGAMPYTYSWSNSKTTSSISSLVSGIYSVLVTDKYGCTIDTTINVTQPAAPLSVVLTATNVKCSGLSDGGVSAVVSGGTKPYTYSWSNGATTSSLTNVPAGYYCVTVTDSNNCRTTKCDTISQPKNTLDSVRICMVTVDTASQHNIIGWNNTGLNNVDSFKVYYLNSSSTWQKITEVPFSSTQYIDTSSINNPNANTVRYCLTGIDSCGDEELIASSAWQNTMYIDNSPPGTFVWSGTGYLIQNVTLPVLTYYLYRDTLSNGHWQAIDSVSGTQNKMTDPNYLLYPHGRWYVGAKLNVTGCSAPEERFKAASTHASSRSNIQYKNTVGIAQLQNDNSVSIYPNPASEQLTVKFEKRLAADAEINITDVTGRIIMSIRNKFENNNSATFNISNLTTGIYFIRIETNSSTQVVKFIKE